MALRALADAMLIVAVGKQNHGLEHSEMFFVFGRTVINLSSRKVIYSYKHTNVCMYVHSSHLFYTLYLVVLS